jgi:gliding motility-associated-like protein
MNAQTPVSKSGWTQNPFEHKLFIENRGQFDGKNSPEGKSDEAVLFGASSTGVALYFTEQGLCYRYDEVDGRRADEQEKENTTQVSHFVSMRWAGANPHPKISSTGAGAYSFAYSSNAAQGLSGIRASGYKKIIYQELYDHIDVEYTFPVDREGIKYTLILHPGADASRICMEYSSEAGLHMNEQKNISIHTAFGDFTDHAPVTYYEGGARIPSAFRLNRNRVSFDLSPEKKDFAAARKKIIIDPWTTNPNLAGFNSAYDVDYDVAGNVYVYGGQGGAASPFEEVKLNAAGVIQWVYVANPYTQQCYGDFVVDHNSGTSYLAEGYNPSGPRVLKINASGFPTQTYPGTPTIQEFWRMVHPPCTDKLIMGGGGHLSNQGFLLDTAFSSGIAINVLSTTGTNNDIVSLGYDNAGDVYMTTAAGSYNNYLFKFPGTTLTPYIYAHPDNYSFTEANSVNYVNNNSSWVENAMNAIAISSKYLYTYDGDLLQRWNPTSGTMINSVHVTGTSFTWGGIAVNDCDNIFVGTQSSVIQYDTTLTVIATIPTAGVVYDVNLSPNNKLYVSGKGFVSSYSPSGISCSSGSGSMSATTTTSASCSSSSATVNVAGGTPSYMYSWNPGGQTTQTAINLSGGTYTVTVMDASCPRQITTALVTVQATSGPVLNAQAQTNVICNGASTGTVTMNVSGGTGPYVFSWNTTPVQTTSTAIALPAGTYTCAVTDNSGCSTTSFVIITQPGALSATTSQTSTCISNSNGSASVHLTGPSAPYIYSWNTSPVQKTDSASGLPPGTYTCAVTDANGCSSYINVQILGADTCELFIPNIFSPDGDGINDFFHIRSEGYSNFHVEIFNRWGIQVFISDDNQLHWNGKIHNTGAEASEGTYYYLLTVSSPNTPAEHHRGFLTLVRNK